ncbi:MAG: phosphoenolpyruvate carboxykinase (GTP) [Paraburkholderia sp.]|nr:MAG: phosphoenolpyruvate carboxykinase (GTP) [Paraburkholderia sp.]TAM30205.1 MAG: phosphoenolpyruvate carboxykinase (GTP) [Paraburkholderia sp.]
MPSGICVAANFSIFNSLSGFDASRFTDGFDPHVKKPLTICPTARIGGASIAAILFATLPRVFCVNWFRKGPDGKFTLPGFGENMRVLEWMVCRIEGEAGGGTHAFGISPRYEDIDWSGLDFTPAQFDQVISVEADAWRAELDLHSDLFKKLSHGLPEALQSMREKLEACFDA